MAVEKIVPEDLAAESVGALPRGGRGPQDPQ